MTSDREAIELLRERNLLLSTRCGKLNAEIERLKKALEQAKEDLMNLQEDTNSGEFELDHQFAIDRITAALIGSLARHHKPRKTIMNVTTNHAEIGYTNNVQIIECALRERFGFNDNSHVLTAVAAHVWSYICGTSNCEGNIAWGRPEIERAIAACIVRLGKMMEALKQ